jgi:hypothetical protein
MFTIGLLTYGGFDPFILCFFLGVVSLDVYYFAFQFTR